MDSPLHSASDAMSPLGVLLLFLGTSLVVVGIAVDVMLWKRLRREPVHWAGYAQRMRDYPWDLWNSLPLLIMVPVTYLLTMIALVAGERLGMIDDGGMFAASIVVHSILFQGIGLLVVLLVMRARRFGWLEAFGVSRTRLRDDILAGVTFYVAVVPALWLCSLAYNAYFKFLGLPMDPQDAIRIFLEPGHSVRLQIYVAFLGIIAAPVMEELLLRGVLLPLGLKHFRTVWAIALVSLVFALLHFHLPSILPLYILAATCCLGYLYTGSVVTPIVIHFLFNTVSLGALLLAKMAGMV